MPTAYFVVRALVENAADCADFDRWYRTEHLPEARAAFGARSAWRCWSVTNPREHLAFYEFDDRAAGEAVQTLPALKGLIAEFDRVWGGRVTRERMVLVEAE